MMGQMNDPELRKHLLKYQQQQAAKSNMQMLHFKTALDTFARNVNLREDDTQTIEALAQNALYAATIIFTAAGVMPGEKKEEDTTPPLSL